LEEEEEEEEALVASVNSLPDYVVASPTINTFKARLDKFW